MLKRWLSLRSQPKNKKDLSLIRFIIQCFGYRPKDLLLFKIALTHKSVSNTSKKLISNERLEFLGDTILDAVIADFLFHKFPEEDEGYLTKVKAKIVSRKSLSNIGKKINIDEHLVYQKGRSIQMSTLTGNAFEAIVGAIYLDGGYNEARKSIFHTILRIYVDLPTLLKNEIDFKSKLFIWCQKNHLKLEFITLKEESDHGVWRYEMEVYINNKPFGRGIGQSKKIAEQAAAKETMELIGNL